MIKRPTYHFNLLNYMRKLDLTSTAQNIKSSTIIIWGEKDYMVPLWQGEKLHELIKGSKLIVLKGMDHDWILHSPELFWQNIV